MDSAPVHSHSDTGAESGDLGCDPRTTIWGDIAPQMHTLDSMVLAPRSQDPDIGAITPYIQGLFRGYTAVGAQMGDSGRNLDLAEIGQNGVLAEIGQNGVLADLAKYGLSGRIWPNRPYIAPTGLYSRI